MILKRIFILVCIIMISMPSPARNTCPRVIPAIKQWDGAKGGLILNKQGRIVMNPSDEAILSSTAVILAEDLNKLLGWKYEVTAGKPQKNDIFISISEQDEQLGKEGYVLSINRYVSIDAPTARGVFWGTRTLLQMLYMQDAELPKGVARDWPEFPNRGFMLDVGRKFFSLEYLKQQIKVLSFYKMNEFQIHLNDNGFPQFFDNDWKRTYAAFRLESDRFPGLTAKDGSYTKDEFMELQKMAREYGVNIIPEIDIPAHSLAFTHYKPELASREYGMDHLDIYKEETYNFVDSLLDEYLSGDEPVFIGPDVHIGTDEYNKKEAEQYRYFTDRYLKYVAGYGKSPRMWGGLKWLPGETPVTSEGVTVNAWSYDWIDPITSLKDGYKLINTCDTYLYIVPGAGYYREFLDHQWLYETWTPWKMNRKQTLPEGTPGVLGAMFAVWNDHCGNGISEQDVYYRSFPALQVMAERLWKGDNQKIVPYHEFEELCKTMPEAPGVNLLGRIEESIILDKEVILDGKEVVQTELEEVGYPYTISFSIYPDEDQNNSGILFKGPHSTVYTNWENTGHIAFTRDGYAFEFGSFHLNTGEWTDITIKGDWKGTSLYVNGELKERLEGRIKRVYNPKYNRLENMPIQETLIFPLKYIGDDINGFKGRIKNININNK